MKGDLRMNLLVGVPTYDGRIDFQVHGKIYEELAGRKEYAVACWQSSLLAQAFNSLYCAALNARPECRYFLLWHSDVRVIPKNFIDGMVAELERLKAGCLSVLIPIKDERGITSSGLIFKNAGSLRRRRLTMKEAAGLPETFSARELATLWNVPSANSPCLLANTGLMLIDISSKWADKLYFTIRDKIIRGKDGKFEPIVESEDWWISRQLQKFGSSVYVTRKFQALHRGACSYTNQGVWGSWDFDQLWESTSYEDL